MGQRGEARTAGIDEYDSDSLLACERALCTVVSRVGPWGERLILIGGLAPRYLIPKTPEGIRPHVGTTDVDLVLGLVIDTLDKEPYRTLQRNLDESGFRVYEDEAGTRHSDQWVREVGRTPVKLEFFCPVGDGLPGRLVRNPAEGAGARLSARRLRGADLAGRDNVEFELERETLDGGGVRKVAVRVAGVLPFLALKTFALSERVKDKDAYDLIWLLQAHEAGPEGVARAVAQSPVVNEPVAREALLHLPALFDGLDSPGASQYARFHLGQAEVGSDTGTRLKRDAMGAVRTFVRAWEDLGFDPR